MAPLSFRRNFVVKSSRYILFFVAAAAALQTARACDLCGCYTPQIEAMPQSNDVSAFGQPSPTAGSGASRWFDRSYFAIAQQFTYFNTLQFEGSEVANPTDQYLASSITQLVAGYSFTPRFALQLNVPLIYRSFERPDGFAIDRGTEAGLGDVTLLGKFVVLHKEAGGR